MGSGGFGKTTSSMHLFKLRRAFQSVSAGGIKSILRAALILTVLWCELGTFSWHLADCRWPESRLNHQQRDEGVPWGHILLIADPQLLSLKSYPNRPKWLNVLTRFIVDYNLKKSWRVIVKLNPNVIIFMGDLMDDGRSDMPQTEYEEYVYRFNRTFQVNSGTPIFFLPGNHDVGLNNPGWFSTEARSRFERHFGPANRYVEINGVVFVLIDAPKLVEEESHRQFNGYSLEHFIEDSESSETVLGFVHRVSLRIKYAQPVVLLSHIPLARPSTVSCGPLREKGTIRKGGGIGYQNLLEDEATNFMLGTLKPTIIFSGDDHDYCETTHEFESLDPPENQRRVVREVTIKSISMAMGIRRPGFQVLSIATWNSSKPGHPSTMIMDQPCNLPDQIALYLWVYLPAVICSIGLLAMVRSRTNGLRSSTMNTNSEDDGWEHLDVELDVSKTRSLLPASASKKEVLRRENKTLQSWLTRPLWSIFPSRWRIYLLRRIIPSGRSDRSPLVSLFMDIVEVTWPVIIVYVVVTLFILW